MKTEIANYQIKKLDKFYGVWANKDCELVRTGKYFLLFEREGETLKSIFIEINANDDKIEYRTRGMAIFDTSMKNSDVCIYKLPKRKCTVSMASKKISIQENDAVIEELMPSENILRVLTGANKWQELKLVEKINIVNPYQTTKANAQNIGKCLQEWQLGSKLDHYLGGIGYEVIVNTNKHSYIFSFLKTIWWSFIYCRAARIRSNNQGTVFAQNIRMTDRKWKNIYNAYMADNNFETTSKDVEIDSSLFNPIACSYAKDGIYWSLRSYNENIIVLHGCQQKYTFIRPEKSLRSNREWFEYKE